MKPRRKKKDNFFAVRKIEYKFAKKGKEKQRKEKKKTNENLEETSQIFRAFFFCRFSPHQSES